jgi:hypothetical protein
MTARFSAIPRLAIDDDRLSANDLLVLMALGCHTDEAGWCWPSQTTLAKKARLSRNTVTLSMKALVKRGYVEIFKPANGDLSKIRYRVILDTARAPATEQTQDVATPCPADGQALASQTGKLARGKGKLVADAGKPCPADGHKQEPTNKPKEQDGRVDALFEEIWGPWERHRTSRGLSRRGDGKAMVRKQFARKAEKTDPAIIRTAALAHLSATKPEYLAGLSVWLNGESYDAGENVVSIDSTADWENRLYGFTELGSWRLEWGPKPGQPGCLVPARFLQPQPMGQLL